MDVSLLTENHIGQMLIFSWRTFGGFNKKPGKPNGKDNILVKSSGDTLQGELGNCALLTEFFYVLPASFLGAGLQVHPAPLSPARQGQIHILWLIGLDGFSLLF